MKIFFKAIFVILCVITLSACSRINQENFDQIQTGMSMSAVITILGEPTTSESVNFAGISGTSATWKNNNAVITIQFLNDKVQIKSYSRTDQGNTNDTPSTPAS